MGKIELGIEGWDIWGRSDWVGGERFLVRWIEGIILKVKE